MSNRELEELIESIIMERKFLLNKLKYDKKIKNKIEELFVVNLELMKNYNMEECVFTTAYLK